MSKILVVDDEARILLLLKSLFKSHGFDVVTAHDGPTALDLIAEGGIDVTITDLRMTPMDGLTLFREIKGRIPAMPVILLTAYASVETALEAMKAGIFDYVTKPFKVDELMATVRRAEELAQKNATIANAGVDAPLRYQFESVIASSPAMVHVCDMMQKVAPTAATVLINGESGTGKEVIARTLHKASPRATKPWIAVNCAALPETLLESEMFGHVKGAYTGAHADKEGLFEAANGGTIFLDEISSLPLLLQGKLLRVLQEREIRRVGGTKSIPIDVRVIAASNTNLEQAVVNGTFRADLYYRFAVITLDIPPLRERTEDILPLARHFIKAETMAGKATPSIHPDAVKALLAYTWPGNVRELENAIQHAMTFLKDGEITCDILPSKVTIRTAETVSAPVETAAGTTTSLKQYLKQKEKEYLEHILNDMNGDKEKAAETLQVSLATLYRKLSDE